MQCRYCAFSNPPDFQYCGRCGSSLVPSTPPKETLDGPHSERRNVTILFSDLSAYTHITEKYDPEDVQAIMGEIFDRSRHIIQSYGGSVERFLGDEIMAVFGNPITHEDDAIRAINAAREIHRAVESISERELITHPLRMHTGINTGIVVTDDEPPNRLSLGITGDAANLAKRLQGFAKPGEIIVGRETFRQAVGYFNFKSLDVQPVKGRREAVSMYRFLGVKHEPRKVRRIFGRRAEIIAREKEIDVFSRAISDLGRRGGGILCISGEAGTGKSRLVEEFKKRLRPDEINWCEGYAFEFTRNNSYFPVTDLLRRKFGIYEEDPPASIRGKINRGTSRWTAATGLVDVLGGLFDLESRNEGPPQLIDPEHWKSNLHRAMALLFDAMASRKPMVVCLEDLHWADPSTIDLLSFLFAVCRQPILFLMVFRPEIANYHPGFLNTVNEKATLLPIGDLTPTDCDRMVCSLLGTTLVPDCLKSLLGGEFPGNPFFLEEAVNALIESDIIIPSGETWVLNRPLDQLEIALSVRGIIASRIDRLETEAKSILREASVIGSTFSHEILNGISRASDRLDACLSDLVNLDLIRIKRYAPSLEYSFKHTLIREVVYDGILKAERRAIHARIALSIERLFGEHLPEHFEMLAYHFKNGDTAGKAITYLMRAGRKSLRRYAVEESHRYFEEAFELISRLDERDDERDERLIETLANWFPVYYYRGRFGEAEKRMQGYLQQAGAIANDELRGMFYIGYGMCLWARERFQEAHDYMVRALHIGRSIDSRLVEGYVHAWLIWVCVELGLPEEAIAHGRSARTMAEHFDTGHYPYYQSLDSEGFACWTTGDSARVTDCSRALMEYSKANPSSRVTTWAHFTEGLSQLTSGHFNAAADTMREALKTSSDPLYTMFLKLFLGIASVSGGDYVSTRVVLQEVLDHGRRYGCEVIGTPAELFLSISRCSDGNMRKQIATIKRIIRHWEENGARWRLISAELALGEFYLNLRLREKALPLRAIVRNLPFLITAMPLAARRAEGHFQRALDIAQATGAKGLQGQACLGLARLFNRLGLRGQALHAVDQALELFQMGQAEAFIRTANQLKSSIEQA